MPLNKMNVDITVVWCDDGGEVDHQARVCFDWGWADEEKVLIGEEPFTTEWKWATDGTSSEIVEFDIDISTYPDEAEYFYYKSAEVECFGSNTTPPTWFFCNERTVLDESWILLKP